MYQGRFSLWISIRSIVVGYNEIATINDAEHSEFDAMSDYRKIASLYLPPKVTVSVLRLIGETKKNNDHIKAMLKSIELIASKLNRYQLLG